MACFCIEIGLLLLAVSYLLYKWGTKNYNIFEERNVKFEKPWPVLGNMANVAFQRSSFFKSIIAFYERNKSHKVVGFYNFRDAAFMVNDPELIKKITVKDFDHFPNHKPFFDVENEPLFSAMLFIMKDQRWKDMRNTLTPVFTASKMRIMFPLMNECFDESLNELRNKTKGANGYEFELKEFFSKLSNDIIASTAFGLKINSYKDPNNEFYSIGKTVTQLKAKQTFVFFLSSIAPKVVKLFGLKVFDAEKTAYFVRLVVDAIKYREENNIVRPDMIQLLMEAKKESTQNWTDDEIVAQCFIFFFAAFENNANLICTTCFELVQNPDIAQRLYEECVELRTELNGNPLTYDAVGKLKYMDMVLSESLRKWTLNPFMDRLCSKDYTLKDEAGNHVIDFKKGDHIWFPVVGLHWNPQYFEEPELFNPERFSDDNKANIDPFAYLPFGVGPRNCIGNRYALMQAKAILYYLILDFKMERTPKTVKNLADDQRGMQFGPKQGYWMRFVARKN